MAATGPIDHILRPKVANTEEVFGAGRSLPISASSYTADNMPPGVSRIVLGARRIFEARTMQEHEDVTRDMLSKDVAWDAPPIITCDRDDLRVCAYLAKSIAYLTLYPRLVQVLPIGNERTIVEVHGVCSVMPKRTWLIPLTMLLPKELPIRATIRLGVKGPLETGKIELIDGKWHNLPSLPNFIREFNGFMMGTVPHWTEGLWGWTTELVGDDYYKMKREGKRGVVYGAAKPE
jgi:hypothetical protein